MNPIRTLSTLGLLAGLLGSPLAFAQEHAEQCEPVPKAQWKPQAELERKLTNQGWKVSRVKVTNGCYEVYGRDEKNRKVEVFFHPVSLALVTAEAGK